MVVAEFMLLGLMSIFHQMLQRRQKLGDKGDFKK